MAVEPRYDDSVDFLRWFSPQGPWCLVAIAVDKKGLVGITFHPGQEAQIRTWLTSVGETHNIYFSVNPVLRDINTKPRREDIASMEWLHVDIDPRVGEDLEEERGRILALLREFDPAPSCIIFSGGGYQAFWRLSDPFKIDGRPELYEQAKRWNLQLELLLGGDACHNVDRIMRLPGTINRPDAKKLKKGRTKALAHVVEHNDHVYPLKKFTAAPTVQSEDGFSASKVTISGNVRRISDLNELPVGDLCKVVIAQGSDPDDPARWQSRSEPLFWVCCELVRANVPDETIFSLLTDPDWGISSSVLEKGSRAERYAIRQIERAKEETVDPWLRKLNEEWAVVMIGGKTRLITERSEVIGEQQRSRIFYMSFPDFENYYRNKFVEIPSGDKFVHVPAGKWWLNHPQRREYKGVVFSPGREVPDMYNLWRGFSVEARPGDCSLFLQHVRENICSGSEEHYNYLFGWMASAVQHPEQQGNTAIVLRGRQGTGKGVFANTFGALFGRHFLAVRDSQHLFGQFNAHLQDCVVLFADEAFWAGNKKQEGMLKSLVTESQVLIEGKGRDAELSQNYIHLIMASNEDWVVPAGLDDRRFFVLDVGANRIQDHTFFASMARQMRSGGSEALLHSLMSYDLTEFNIRRVPRTLALQDQKLRSMHSEHDWWMQKLLEGRLMESHDGWKGEAYTTELQWDFTRYARAWSRSYNSSPTKLGMFLKAAVPGGCERVQLGGRHNVIQTDGELRNVERPYAYRFPDLGKCRDHWDRHFGGPYEWPEIRVIEEQESEVSF